MIIAIIDDDESQTEELKIIISEFLKSEYVNHTIFTFSSGEEFVDSYEKFDAVFLDIKMYGMDGIEAGQEFRRYHKKTAIFYVTSYPEYIMDTMTVHPFAFITKPVNKEAVCKNLDDYLKYMDVQRDRMIVPTDDTFQFLYNETTMTVNLNDIYYFRYIGNRSVEIVTKSGIYKIKKSMSKLYGMLDSKIFLFPHQSFIVNVNYIKYVNGKNKTLTMKNGDIVFVSRRKYSDILNSMNKTFLK